MSVEEVLALAREDELAPAVTLARGAASPEAPLGGLTPREQEVVVLLARGMSNRQIADELVISPHTVQRHVENILGKLGFSSRTQIAGWAVSRGLVHPVSDRVQA
jgi:DNA-binding NarL/FixJ family response regulator